MSDKPPMLTDVHFEQLPDRLKIVLPVKHSIPLIILYSFLVILWLGMMVGGIIYTIQIATSGERYAFVFTFMLAVLVLVLYRFGRYLLRQWAHLVSNREIMFINKDILILRRPISVFGNTDAYDMGHVTPFYLSEKPAGPAFDYGYRHTYFGDGLTQQSALALINFLNGRFFPNHVDELDDEDD